MDEFLVVSASGEARLLFFDREPFDRDQPLDSYSVRITDRDLSAIGNVYAGYANTHPAPLFAEMALRWQGWPDELEWDSLEGEFGLRCSHDRLGHIRIDARLGVRMGHWQFGWEVQAAVMVEGGQLDRLAQEAAAFFGQPSGT